MAVYDVILCMMFECMPWKKDFACLYETCVPLWFDVTKDGSCDHYSLLVDHKDWLE